MSNGDIIKSYTLTPQFSPPRQHLTTGCYLPNRQIHNLSSRKFYNGVVEVSKNYGTNYDMTMLVALAFVAVCCQGMAKVKKPRGGLAPISLMVLILATSGARKSPLVKAFFTVIKELQKELLQEYEAKVKKFEHEYEIWEEITRALKAKIRSIIQKGGSISEVESELRTHLRAEPKKPLRPKFLYEDVTGPGLWKSMKQCVRSAAVVSSEASAALGKWLQQDLCNFNSANDGEVIDIARSGDGTFEIPAILTFLLMLQPELFDKFLDKKGDDLRDLGIFARFLVCRPASLAGQRFDDGAEQSTQFLRTFQQRGRELLLLSYRVMCGEKKALEIDFQSDAKRLWFDILNEIESKQQPGNDFNGMRDHASKMMDIISRVAACLYLFEGYKGGISTEILLTAKEICFYCADYYNSQFVHPPEAVRDAIVINDYLNRHYSATDQRLVKKSDVRNGVGIKPLRLASRFDPALFQLKHDGVIGEWRQKIPGRKETIWIDLCPNVDLYIYPGSGEWYCV
jgi:hypothetical protein